MFVNTLLGVLQTKTCSPYESCTDNLLLHRKKGFSLFPSPAGMSLTEFFLGGYNLYMTSLFPPRESLVSDIPAGDGNIEKLFYGVLVIGWPNLSSVQCAIISHIFSWDL
jgi:hypothetical protein